LRTVSFCDAQPVSFPQHLPEKYLWVIERHGRRVRREQPGCILLRTVTLLRPEFQVNGDQVWGYGYRGKEKGKRNAHQGSNDFHLVYLSQVLAITLRARSSVPYGTFCFLSSQHSGSVAPNRERFPECPENSFFTVGDYNSL
jgi:hypothetical protein